MAGYEEPGEPLVSRMKPVAARLPAVVAARDAAGFARLAGLARDRRDLLALVALLAESADVQRLAEVTAASPRAAHREYQRLRRAGRAVPWYVREGERLYRAELKRAQRARRGGGS